jgi:heme-degrading monooxygenase HmoA
LEFFQIASSSKVLIADAHRATMAKIAVLAPRDQEIEMFVAMNRFKVVKGEEKAFEEIWAARRTRLDEMEGFVAFHLLKGPEHEDHTLYASHTIWETKASFLAWTTSQQFRDAHKDAGKNKHVYAGPPQFEGFESVLGEAIPRFAVNGEAAL